LISSTDQGQGIDTVLQQLIAQSLHLEIAAVRVVRGHTARLKGVDIDGVDLAALMAAILP
jgi:CO/xanthine dehydrogenase Mo-binding subunit